MLHKDGVRHFLCHSTKNKPSLKNIYLDSSNLYVLHKPEKSGHLVFSRKSGLGKILHFDEANHNVQVQFDFSGEKVRLNLSDKSNNEHLLFDIEFLRDSYELLVKGEALSMDQMTLISTHLSPLPPDKKIKHGIFISSMASDILLKSLKQQLITAPTLEIRHPFVQAMLDKGEVEIAMGPKSQGEVRPHFTEVLDQLRPVVDYIVRLGHETGFALLEKFLGVKIQIAYYEGSYTPAGYRQGYFPIMDYIYSAAVRVIAEQYGFDRNFS